MFKLSELESEGVSAFKAKNMNHAKFASYSHCFLFESGDAANYFVKELLPFVVGSNLPHKMEMLDGNILCLQSKNVTALNAAIYALFSDVNDSLCCARPDGTFNPDWFENSKKASLGILAYDTLPFEDSKAAAEALYKKYNAATAEVELNESVLNGISKFSIEKWRSEMIKMIESNFSVFGSESQEIVDSVIEVSAKHIKKPLFGDVTAIKSFLLSFASHAAGAVHGSDYSASSASLYYGFSTHLRIHEIKMRFLKEQLEALGVTKEDDPDGESLNFAWEEIVELVALNIKPSVKTMYLCPINSDKITSSEFIYETEFEVNRTASCNPSELNPALFLSSDQANGSESNYHQYSNAELVKFLVRDLLNCQAALFAKTMKEDLFEISKNESLTKEAVDSFNSFWDKLMKDTHEKATTAWYGDRFYF